MRPIDGGAGILRFGTFELDTRAGELRRAGVLIKLTPQQLKLLLYLVEHSGEVLAREQIQREIWGSDTVVEFDRNLNVCIAQLRSLLNDDSASPRFVETVPKRGYRFVAPVVTPEEPQAASAVSLPRPWILAGLAAALSATVVVFVFARNPANAAGVRLAVMPFENLSGDLSDEPAVAGLTDELISAFGSVQPARLGVIGRSSVMRYKNSRLALDQIARELHVGYIVEGTMRKSGGRVRVGARLVRVADQIQIWTDTFEQDEANVFQMQEDSAARITGAVLKQLFPDSAVASVKPARRRNREALESYSNGRFLQHKGNLADLNRSIPFFEQAVRTDASFPEAYAALAESFLALAVSGRGGPDPFARANAAAQSALRFDESNAEAHNALANVLFWREWNWPEAERHFSRAIAINPSLALAQHDYGFFLVVIGRTEAGLTSWRRAVAIDPLSTRVNMDGGWLLLQAHRFDDAIRQAQRALELSPGIEEANLCIARARQYQGRGDAEMMKLIRAILDNPAAQPFTYAIACALMHENSKALDALERAYAAHSAMMPMLKTEPAFTPLHGDPRFEGLVQKMKLL